VDKCFRLRTNLIRADHQDTALPKDKMKLTVELVRRGATIMGEPCKTCGGVQVRYHGKVFCTSHDDLSSVLSADELTLDSVTADVRQLMLSKLADLSKQLESETEVEKQDLLVTLMTRCLDLLQKLPQK